jgi:hypothetical protein
MSNEQGKPQFGLARVLQGSAGAPQVFTVEGRVSRSLDRRKVLRLGAGIRAAAALATFWAECATAADAVIAAHNGTVSFLAIPPDASVLLSAAADGFKTI